MAGLLFGWHAAGYRLFIAVVGRDGGGWGAAVLGDGRVAAATLSAVVAAVKARVTELRSPRRPVTGCTS